MREPAMPDAVVPIRYRLRVKQRLVVLAYAEEHGLKPAARHFALSRTTVRGWRDRHRAQGFPGLLPRYPKRRRRRVAVEVIPLVKVARTEHQFGATWSGAIALTTKNSGNVIHSGHSTTPP
jgi:transposase